MSNGSRRSLMLAALAVALIGTTPFTNPGCKGVQVIDDDTGLPRPATQAEIESIAQGGGAVAKGVLLATGQPEWVPLVDVAVRVAALVLAWMTKPKDTTTTSTGTVPVQGG